MNNIVKQHYFPYIVDSRFSFVLLFEPKTDPGRLQQNMNVIIRAEKWKLSLFYIGDVPILSTLLSESVEDSRQVIRILSEA